MLKQVYKKPVCFNHIAGDMNYYDAYYKYKLYMQVGVQIHGKMASVHVDMKQWNHSILKEMKKDWGTLKDHFLEKGVKKVIASYPTEDVKWKKFIRYFDFPEPKTILISEQEL